MKPPHGLRGLAASALLCTLAILLAATPQAIGTETTAGVAAGIDAKTLWDRAHVIGASASAGFGVRPPLPADHPGRLQPVTLASIADAARAGAGTVTGDATGLFFLSPSSNGGREVDGTLAAQPRPTIVIGVDFLFWFTYGAGDGDGRAIRDEKQRLAHLEAGLALADRIAKAGMPLVIGDIPDMSPAVGKMLSKAQMPALETIARANERIRTWAAERPRVAVVPLARLVAELRSGKPFEAGRRTWSEAADGALIQRDQLHPTFVGSLALLACIEQAVNERFLGVTQPNAPGAPRAFREDPAAVAATWRDRADAAPTPARRRPPVTSPR
jgi:hypothetical protein